MASSLNWSFFPISILSSNPKFSTGLPEAGQTQTQWCRAHELTLNAVPQTGSKIHTPPLTNLKETIPHNSTHLNMGSCDCPFFAFYAVNHPIKSEKTAANIIPIKMLSRFRRVLVWWLTLCINLAGPRCPDMWSNIILNVSVEVFLGWDLHLSWQTMNKADCPT